MKTSIGIFFFIIIQFHLFAQLSGTYTIGGNQPYFKYLGEEAWAGAYYGVSGPVNMNKRNGVFMKIHVGYIKNANVLYPVGF
jgi:hypothetical protein